MMERLCPRRLGSLVQANARRLALLLSLALLILCAAINSGRLDVELSSWIQRTSRIKSELLTIESAIGDGAGANSLLILQTPKPEQQVATRTSNKFHYDNTEQNNEGTNNNNNNQQQQQQQQADILSVESMLHHLEALSVATRVTVDLFEVNWSLKDICLAPTPPDYEGLLVNQMLDHLMPCVIKTPLDCFWDGAKLLGPEQDVRLSSLGPSFKWTNLNPIKMIGLIQRSQPHAAFPYQTLIDWMHRVGISSGYLQRPCLSPQDAACPASAPNKFTGDTPDIRAMLTGGCHGLATEQMHWMEEELVGGVARNSSGYIVSAKALQSTVLLMGERDVYDYWRKTSKVQDINNWSIDKAKLVVDTWQRRFKDELVQFSRSSQPESPFVVNALTPKSILEPIDDQNVLDLTNLKLAAAIMTLIVCLVFPAYTRPLDLDDDDGQDNLQLDDHDEDKTQKRSSHREHKVGRCKIVLLALSISAMVIVTFVASLGLSSFMNLPFNMASTQILPPLALLYAFRQALMLANIYSHHYKRTPIHLVTTECLRESMPIIVMECLTFIVPLVVATAFPVQATRVFTLQAITNILLSTLMSLLFVPALMTIFLNIDTEAQQHRSHLLEVNYTSDRAKSRCRSQSPGLLSMISKRGNKCADKPPVSPSVDEQILSRLQDDLKSIKCDPRRSATDFNFSARFGPDGIRTSFSLRTAHQDKSADFSRDVFGASPSIVTTLPEPSNGLPDLLLRPDLLEDNVSQSMNLANQDQTLKDFDQQNVDEFVDEIDHREDEQPAGLAHKFVRFTMRHKFIALLAVLLKLIVVVTILTQAPKIKFGLHLRDLLLKGTSEHESFSIREKYFPVYNIFAITKTGLDYPSKQKLLYEFHERIQSVEGVLNDGHNSRRKFWLTYFRDWLLELQDNFDQERNRSVISKEGWTDDASYSAKLAYKLLAQTGKADNPIDKNLIETNRLVDKNGIINQKAFYYYLTAWVMNDAFTYSTSEADFRPEPKTWNDNPNDLRIERARPLVYAQMPFMLSMPEDQDNMRAMLEIRSISQKFDSIDLPNFPTGIPFLFWDQFIQLDYLFYTAILMITALLLLLAGLAFGNLVIASILILPTIASLLEIYCMLGWLSAPFNSIIGVMIISVIGLIAVHTLQTIACFELGTGDDNDLSSRLAQSVSKSFRTVIISLVLLSVTALVYQNSRIDFMTKYSRILVYIIVTSAYNSLWLTPALLALFGTDHRKINDDQQQHQQHQQYPPIRSAPSANSQVRRSPKLVVKNSRDKKKLRTKTSNHQKKRGYPRVQSEISLSTISEEPQSEAQAHDLNLKFSIRC